VKETEKKEEKKRYTYMTRKTFITIRILNKKGETGCQEARGSARNR